MGRLNTRVLFKPLLSIALFLLATFAAPSIGADDQFNHSIMEHSGGDLGDPSKLGFDKFSTRNIGLEFQSDRSAIYSSLLSKGLPGAQQLGKRIRNLLLACPGLTGGPEFKKRVAPVMRSRVQAIHDLSLERLKTLIGDQKLFENVTSENMPSNWDGKKWDAEKWSKFLASVDELRRMEILENLYNISLTNLSLHKGQANIPVDPSVADLDNVLSRSAQSSLQLEKDRIQAKWMLRGLNVEFLGAAGFSPEKVVVKPSDRSEFHLLKEMRARIDWSQKDTIRPPFGHAYLSCGMNCNSHFIESVDFDLAMACHKIAADKALPGELDWVEEAKEFYNINELLLEKN